MIQSMTGYANKTISVTTPQGRISLVMSIKAFNSRFFETTCKLPQALLPYETDLIKRIRTALIRGHIYATMYLENESLSKKSVTPALSVVEGYMDAIEIIKKQFNLKDAVSLHDILQLPNVFTISDLSFDNDTLNAIWTEIDLLIAAVLRNRFEEGAFLYEDMIKRLGVMEAEIAAIDHACVRSIEHHKGKIQQILHDVHPEDQSLVDARKNALYLALDKMDVHEEIVRFRSHLNALRGYLAGDAAEKGKRVDFILQELSRETNTITAKSSDATIIGHAINLKVEIEKIREQAQNIV